MSLESSILHLSKVAAVCEVPGPSKSSIQRPRHMLPYSVVLLYSY